MVCVGASPVLLWWVGVACMQAAEKRKYTNPNTSMSSKPDAGINHKVRRGIDHPALPTVSCIHSSLLIARRLVLLWWVVQVYGVTSEGIAVFLAVALRRFLDPKKDTFTIKLTGQRETHKHPPDRHGHTLIHKAHSLLMGLSDLSPPAA